jgi:methylmalonyl-CoA mutase N-terminal domain/subunit
MMVVSKGSWRGTWRSWTEEREDWTEEPEESMMEHLGEDFERWEAEKVGRVLKRFPERKEQFRTPSSIPVKRLYTPLDLEGFDYPGKLGFPGAYPFTRGVQPTMYRGRLWTMRQYAGFGSARQTNERFRYLLEKGQTGLSVAFDLPTQIGYDSDHPLSAGEVGKVGVPISRLDDLEVLFDEIPLDRVSVSMTINATAIVLLGMIIALAKRRGIPMENLSGTVQNDILKEYVARGTYRFPPRPSMRLVTDVIAYCSEHIPRWNTISISGYHIREAGATAVQELAFTFANAIAYVDAALKAGLELDRFARRLSFFFNAHSNFFEEIAKFRAARRIWARIMKERFGARDAKSLLLRFHTQTAGSTLTSKQHENNVVRVAFQALAAVLGGTQSLHTNSRDEALALPSEQSVKIALRTQQIIAYESGAADTIDPLGGSYYVEALTDRIETEVERQLEAVDAMGGALEAIERGYMQLEIQKSAYEHQVDVEEGRQVVVGVNRFQEEEKAPESIFRVDPELERQRIEEIRQCKTERESARIHPTLERLKAAATGTDNLVPPVVEAIETGATLGEICAVLGEVFGEFEDSQYY